MSNSDPNQPSMGRPASEQVFCPNCNGGNPPGNTNCMWCGKPLNATSVSATASDSAAAAGTYTPPPTTMPQSQEVQPPPQAYQAQPTPGYTAQTQVTQSEQPAYSVTPPYPQPTSVVTAPPAKSGSGRRILLIVGGVLLGLLLLCGILFGSLFAGVIGLTQPAADAGEKFMAALRDGNYDAAYALCTPSLQEEVGDAATLKDALSSKQPTKWTFTSRNIQNDLATLQGTTTYTGNETGEVEMELRKVGNDWKVSFINLK
jgi:hypothetical protein